MADARTSKLGSGSFSGSIDTNQIAFGSGANAFSGSGNLTWDGSKLSVTGNLGVTGYIAADNIVSVNATSSTLPIQNQVFTPGATHFAVQLTPSWNSENQNHIAFKINPTQLGANSQGLVGIYLTMTKSTGASTLAQMIGVVVTPPSVTGTVTGSIVLDIQDQGTAGITSPRGIVFEGIGAANSIVWGGSALQYGNGAEVIQFMDSTNTRGLRMTMTAAGSQLLNATSGGLKLETNTGSLGFFGTAPATQQAGTENITNSVSSGGVNGTIANYTDLAVYANDSAAIRNNIYQLARSLAQCKNALRLYGLLS